VTAQRFALSGIETSKAQAIAKAASLRPACLIWRRILRQSRPCRTAAHWSAGETADDPRQAQWGGEKRQP